MQAQGIEKTRLLMVDDDERLCELIRITWSRTALQ